MTVAGQNAAFILGASHDDIAPANWECRIDTRSRGRAVGDIVHDCSVGSEDGGRASR